MPHIRILIFVIVTAMIFSCSDKSVSGTTDETVVSSVRVFNPDLTPAVNAAVKVFSVGDTTQIPVYETTTDSKGQYKIEVDYGVYNISVKKDSLAAFQDSVIYHKTYSTLSNDTLDSVHVIYGLVVMEGMQDPRTSTVQILGSDMYSNVSSNGVFVINGVAPGKYTLRAVTTLADYTPTFEHLTITTAAKDTIRDTITMIYTGIPVIDKIHAVYDTVRGIVHLSWDTTDYAYLRDFLIYRDTMPVLTPSTIPVSTSYSCSYSDTLDSAIYNRQGGIVYRVAVRAQSFTIGETVADVEILPVAPYSVALSKSITATLGIACTLSAKVSGYAGSHVTYSWDIGNKGVFNNSLYPETTTVLKDTITNDYQCVMKAFMDSVLFYIDTTYLTTNFTWEKIANGFVDSALTEDMHTVVLGDKIIAFSVIGNAKSVWQSSDGKTWTKNTDSLAIPYSPDTGFNKPVVFLDRICLVDDNGHLWTSSDGVAWNKDTTTFYAGNFFVDGTKIGLMPGGGYEGCGVSMVNFNIKVSTDLIKWDSTSEYNMKSNMYDYAYVNGILAAMGYTFGWSNVTNRWFYLKKDGVVSYSILPDSSYGSALDAFFYFLEVYKDLVLYSNVGSAKIWAYHSTGRGGWQICAQMPPAVYSNSNPVSISTFNNELYMVSTAGVYKAKME
jgi:hypothetical protein